jgi:hypothetical protein
VIPRLDHRVRTFAVIAAFIGASFIVNVSCENAIAAATARNDTVRAEIVSTGAALERSTKLSRENEQLERDISALHLRDSSSRQCVFAVRELQRLSVRNNLRLTSVLRDASSPVVGKSSSESDTYEITLEGAYPKVLSALAATGQLPLVLNVKTISFERLAQQKRPGEDVRVSMQVEVFRMKKTDESRPS